MTRIGLPYKNLNEKLQVSIIKHISNSDVETARCWRDQTSDKEVNTRYPVKLLPKKYKIKTYEKNTKKYLPQENPFNRLQDKIIIYVH